MKSGSVLFIWIVLAIVLGFNNSKKDRKLDLQAKQIDSLKAKKPPPGHIQISDTSLFVVTDKPERHEHNEPIPPGESLLKFAIDENTRIELKIWNY